MEENFHDQLSPNPETNNNCIKCNSPDILAGYPNKLCAPCRQSLINFPIPLWVKLFGAGVAVVMLISLIWLPGNLKAAIALERAEKAEKSLNYVTAQRELEKARKIVPGSVDVLSNLLIAGFNNTDFSAVATAFQGLKDKKITDTVLFNKLTHVVNLSTEYFPSDSFRVAFKDYKTAIPDTALKRYLKKYTGDVYAVFALASVYSDQEKYQLSDSVLSLSLNIDPAYQWSLNMKSMVKRQLGELDSSLYYADRMLATNHECEFALSSKARTLLKMGKNKEGLQLAQHCYALDKAMPYNMATMAMAYHFNKDFKQRDAMIRLSEKDSLTAGYMTFVKDVIANKVKF
ncbi:MAG: hypothetical protein V4592_24125 [Bacteroidota bacterium]